MSKRNSNFDRIPKDLYKTPFNAVLSLIPYLRRDGIKTFAEPCCGDGDLIRHLESFGLVCVSSGDITTGQNALDLTAADCNGAHAIITNTPYKHPEDSKGTRLARDLMRHFLSITPAIPLWLLIQHDWTANQNMAAFLKRCTDIVVIGRPQWILNSKCKNGFDNASWARFDARHHGDTRFFNDRDRHETMAELVGAAE